MARLYSSWSAQGRTSNMPATLQLLERRVLEHQLPLAAVVGEADGDEAARLDPHDDALAERRVAGGGAGREVGDVLAWRDLALPGRVVARPRGRPQPLALDVRVRQLVEEAGGQVVVATAVEHPRGGVQQRQPLLRPRHADVAKPPLLLDPLLLDRARVRKDPLLHPDQGDRTELEALRVVQGHERDERAVAAARVLVGVERDLLQERRESLVLCLRLLAPLARDRDELPEVLDPGLRLDRALGLEGLHVAASLEDLFDQLRHLVLLRGGHERLDRAAEALQSLLGSRADAGHLGLRSRLPERDLALVGPRLEARERRVADAAPWPVGDAQERDRVIRVVEHLEISDEVLDLSALVEARAADHLVRHALTDEDVLEHAALRVGAVEDGDLAAREALLDEQRDLGGDIARLGVLVLDLDDPHRVAVSELRPEVLLLSLAVVADDPVRGVEDVLGRAVVLVEGVGDCSGEVLLELEDVADIGGPEAVDRLVRIAHYEEVAVLLGEELEQAVLRMIRVLVLVDEDVAERLLPLLAGLGEALEHVDREEEHVVEVDGVRGEETLLVEVVDLGDGLVVEARDALGVVLGADERVLRVRDLGVDAPRREALRVALELLEAALHEPDLVGLVVDREVRAVAEPLRLAAQDPAAGGMERHHPGGARGRPDEVADALAHLRRRLVRERDREDLGRLDADRAEQMRDAAGEDSGLSGGGSGDDEHRAFGVEDGLALRRIQVGEVGLRGRRGHRSIVAAVSVRPCLPSRYGSRPCRRGRATRSAAAGRPPDRRGPRPCRDRNGSHARGRGRWRRRGRPCRAARRGGSTSPRSRTPRRPPPTVRRPPTRPPA